MDSSAFLQSPEMYESEYIAIATVGKPVGLEGWCRIFPFGTTLEKVNLPYRLMAGLEKTEVSIILKELRFDGKGYRGLFERYETRELVDTLKNFQLFVKRENLPAIEHDEFYHFELEGMALFCYESKERIGTVIRVHNYPTVDALEVKRESDSTCVVPMTKEAIREIDKKGRRIFIDDSVIEELL